LGCSPFKALYGYEPKVGAAPQAPPSTSDQVADIIANRELHFQALKNNLARAQNRIKLLEDKHRTDF
jgi:hypothetical protein